MEVGDPLPEDGRLFARVSFKDALPEVSKVRLEQTLYSEYPKLRIQIEKLRGAKTLHTIESLAEICGLKSEEAAVLAQDLVDVGFFEQRGTREAPTFWIPFLYRDALDLVQGSAD